MAAQQQEGKAKAEQETRPADPILFTPWHSPLLTPEVGAEARNGRSVSKVCAVAALSTVPSAQCPHCAERNPGDSLLGRTGGRGPQP